MELIALLSLTLLCLSAYTHSLRLERDKANQRADRALSVFLEEE